MELSDEAVKALQAIKQEKEMPAEVIEALRAIEPRNNDGDGHIA